MDGSRLGWKGVVFQAGLQVNLLGTGHSHSPVPRLPSALKLWNRQYGRELLPGTSKSPCRVVGGDRPFSNPEP